MTDSYQFIEYIIFDIAGVFLDGNIETFINRASQILSENIQNRSKNHQCLNEDLNLGNIGIVEYIENFVNRSLSRKEASEIKHEWNRTWILNNAMHHLAKELKANGYILCLSSNSDTENSEIYEKKNYYDVFDYRFFSHIMKKLKPNDDHFFEICKTLASDPNECVFIDDDKGNVKAAKKFGFFSIHVDRNMYGLEKALFLRQRLLSLSIRCKEFTES